MENIHGIDVSWIHNTHNKDYTQHSKSSPSAPIPLESTSTPSSAPKLSPGSSGTIPDGNPQQSSEPLTPSPKPIPVRRPAFSRSSSADKVTTLHVGLAKPGSTPPGMGRRNTWLSSFSSKFSSSPGSPPANNGPTSPPVPKQPLTPETYVPHQPAASSPKNVLLPHASAKINSTAPYVPAPPKSAQPNFIQSAFRRLSSSGGQLSAPGKAGHHGLCERKVLNVDPNRERCRISELDQSKLRRVAFCVDVEIASGPRYTDGGGEEQKMEKSQKKPVERGEGEALKHPQAAKDEKESGDIAKANGQLLPKAPKPEAEASSSAALGELTAKDVNKKKEKKKRSEEERKARKEKKRKLAEANGTVPVELIRDGSDSDTPPGTVPGTPKIQAVPTTDPLRIYRRCCQLRETPVLKKIADQLSSPTNCGVEKGGVVSKLDLSGYWLQLQDIVTLADYFAVVPIKELILENCGLTDEGARVILAGLLAAKTPGFFMRRRHKREDEAHTGGVVERLILKNNPKIGRDGWRYICLFLHLSRSIKCVDLSMIPFPQPPVTANDTAGLARTPSNVSVYVDTAVILAKALAERFGASQFELMNMAETGLTANQLDELISGICKSSVRRLGLAGNDLTAEGMSHIARYLKHGRCEGLDLGGNDIKDLLGVIADALDENHPLWALSLANCALTPDSLWKLFPAIAKLKNFRFIDLSHNHDLFCMEPSALSLLRRYLPRMPILKRIHLTDVSMTPEQAIALAEILPECPQLAHVNIMENPQLSALANALDEVNQEEACALYASLMAAVRVSTSLVCIDIDVPSTESSEVVKALAKQVVAYCLRNMERGTEFTEASPASSDYNGGEKEVTVPDVLLHLVGHVEGQYNDNDEPAPDEDYVIGGTGVVKALSICLRNRLDDSRSPPRDRENSDSEASWGTNTPVLPVSGGKAKNMSKNLLESARKIRARLQPALLKEASGDHMTYARLLFLDQTLERMIKRFEDEYPETRIPSSIMSSIVLDAENGSPSKHSILLASQWSDTENAQPDLPMTDDEYIRPVLSRHNSDVSLASKALSQEEGRMHRFGQQIRRDIFRPETEDVAHGTTGKEMWAPHLQILRGIIEELGGDEIRRKVESGGQEAVIEELNNQASLLRQKLISNDPEGWERFKDAQEAAERNLWAT